MHRHERADKSNSLGTLCAAGRCRRSRRFYPPSIVSIYPEKSSETLLRSTEPRCFLDSTFPGTDSFYRPKGPEERDDRTKKISRAGRRNMASNRIKWWLCTLFCSLPAAGAWADGAVYAMTNALDNNQVLVYHRAASGSLSLAQTVATGGGGSGLQLAGVDALGSAGSVQLDPDHRLLFVVNTE